MRILGLVLAAAAVVLGGCGGSSGGRKPSSGASTASPGEASGGGGDATGSAFARVADFGDPTPLEQELVELANRARRDPVAEGQRLGADLKSFPPLPPLTPNAHLARACAEHAASMAKRRFYGHVDPDGLGPTGRILKTPYDLNELFGKDPRSNFTENLAAATGTLRDAKEIHKTFIADAGHNPPKHRNLLLGLSTWASDREIGIAVTQDNRKEGALQDTYVVQELARTKFDAPFVTGVVFCDKDLSGAYDAGEGEAGVTVTLRASDGTTVATTTATAGGYAFELRKPGTYEVEIQGGRFGEASRAPVTVDMGSVKVDGVVGLGAVVR